MKEFSTFQRQNFTGSIFRGFLFLLTLCLLSGCDNGSSFKPASGFPETASAAFSIVWHDISDLQLPGGVIVKAQAEAVDCSLIDTIVCEVYDASGNDLTTATFACSAREGTVTGIPVGSNRQFVILGLGGGDILYHGEILVATISAGQTNNLGVIDVYPFFVSDEDRSPADTSSMAPGDVSFQWSEVENASQYNVVISTDTSFQTTVRDALTPDTTFTPSVSLGPGAYYWTVLPLDAHLNQGAAASAWSFSVISAVECSYSISPTESDPFSTGGGTGTISVTASADDCTWSATPAADWVTIISGAGGSGNGTVTYSISTNTTGAERTTTIAVAGRTHAITQEGGCSTTIEPESDSFSSDGGTGTISVTTSADDCTWSVSSSAEWVTITLVASGGSPFGTSGTGDGTVAYTVLANTSEEERESTITIADQAHTITQAGATAPDLVITTGSLTVEPLAVAPGESVSVDTWTMQNQGTADAGAFYIGYYLSQDSSINTWDTNLLSISISGLSTGEEYDAEDQDLTIPQDIESGTYYIGILVDHTNAVSESNEDNNDVSRQITVASFVDLVITTGSPTVTPSSVYPGDDVVLSGWTVENQGTLSSGGFANGFYFSMDAEITNKDWQLDGNSNASLAPGEAFNWGGPTLSIPTDINIGTYYIGILVDRTEEITESSEANNYVSREIEVVYPQ